MAVACAPQNLEASVGVDCRVTDRDQVLYQEPIRVEWRAAANESQPVNPAVLVAVAEVLAERARATALAANRKGELAEARRVVRDIIEHLRGLLPGNARIDAIVARLQREESELGERLDPISLKQRHFASHVAAMSRIEGGKARRR